MNIKEMERISTWLAQIAERREQQGRPKMARNLRNQQGMYVRWISEAKRREAAEIFGRNINGCISADKEKDRVASAVLI